MMHFFPDLQATSCQPATKRMRTKTLHIIHPACTNGIPTTATALMKMKFPSTILSIVTKALRMAFFSAVSVRVRDTSKPFFGFMTGLYRFLVACTRLYNPLCRSVRPSVRPSVGPSVRPSHFTFLYYNVNS